MCVIAVKPANVTPAESVWRNCFESNPDGAGVAWVADGQLTVKKGLMKVEEVLEVLAPLSAHEVVVHFRIASTGMVVSPEMTHPFTFDSEGDYQLDDDPEKGPQYQFAVVHNGKLPWRDTGKESDTCLFVRELLGPVLSRHPYLLDQPEGLRMLESWVTERNKLVVLRHDLAENETKTIIVNRKAGQEAHGCWFSNYSYLDIVEEDYASAAGYNYKGSKRRRQISAFLAERHWDAHSMVANPRTASILPNRHVEPGQGGRMFSDKDSFGWFWSYERNCWVNDKTGATSIHLTHRPVRPYTYDKRLADEAAAKLERERKEKAREAFASMRYLSEAQRKQVLGVACEWYRLRFGLGKDVSVPNLMYTLQDLRKEVKALFSHLAANDYEADQWVLARCQMGQGAAYMLKWAREDKDKGVRTPGHGGGTYPKGAATGSATTHVPVNGVGPLVPHQPPAIPALASLLSEGGGGDAAPEHSSEVT